MCSNVREACSFTLDVALARLAWLQSPAQNEAFTQRVLQHCCGCVGGGGQAGVGPFVIYPLKMLACTHQKTQNKMGHFSAAEQIQYVMSFLLSWPW